MIVAVVLNRYSEVEQRSWVSRRWCSLGRSDRWWHHGRHELSWCGLRRKRHHVVDRSMMKLLRRGGVRLIVAWRHRKSTGSVVARIVLPGDQVVPIHAIRDQVVIVFTSACFASLGGGTPIPSAPSSGSVTIIPW